jgi:hypothetical protein
MCSYYIVNFARQVSKGRPRINKTTAELLCPFHHVIIHADSVQGDSVLVAVLHLRPLKIL